MASNASPEVKSILSKTHDLRIAFSLEPLSVAEVLLSKGFISNEIMSRMLVVSYTPSEKAAILIEAVRNKIELAPTKFTELLEILSDQTCAKDVVGSLRSTYQSYQVSGPASAYCILSDDNLLAQQQIQTVADLNVQAEQVLTEEDVVALLNLIHNFSDKWHDIGVGLGFAPSELNQISCKQSLFMLAPASFLTELLSQWVQWPTVNHPIKPTLRAICEVLGSSFVGLGSLAEEVEREMKCFATELGIVSELMEAMKIGEQFRNCIIGGSILEITLFLDCKLKNVDQPLLIADSVKCTALEFACIQRKTEIVRLLLDRGANIHLVQPDHYPLLIGASIFGYVEVVKLLIEYGAEIDEVDSLYGMTALHETSKVGHVEVVSVLLQHGAKVDLQRKDGCTALMLASVKGQTKVVEILLKNGAQINLQGERGVTALLMACFGGKVDVAKVLLEQGALVDARDTLGYHSLHLASLGGHTATVQVLLEFGVTVDIVSNLGRTALMMASAGGHTSTVKILLEYGAQVDLQDNMGETALMEAVKNDTNEITQLLLEYGAKVDLQNNGHESALFIACSKKKVNNAKILVKHGANIHLESNCPPNNTPLTLARISGNAELVRILLRQPTLKDALRELLPLSQDWQSIGTFLDFDEDELDRISVEYPNAKDSLKALLRQWLNRSRCPPTWKSLIEAIRPLSENTAEVLATKYLN